MKCLLFLGKFVLQIIYTIIKLFPIKKNKVTFISRQSNVPSVDIKLITSELIKHNIKPIILCKTLDKGIKNKILYLFHMFKQMYHIATSKVIVLDSYCIVVGILKHKKKTKIIQMWHALGAFKKFGKSIIGKTESKVDVKGVSKISAAEIAEIMGMHKNYNYVFASSKNAITGLSEAFGYNKSYFKIFPMARLDLIVSRENQKNLSKKIYERYPELKKKTTILYCPTFRKTNNDEDKIKELINDIDYKKYNLVIKLHPLSSYEINDERVIVDKFFNTYEMGFVSDLIITDYSAVVFELSCLSKPIYFYAYDKDEYIDNRDFYLNYDLDMPGPISSSANELLIDITTKKYDYQKLTMFREKYIANYHKSYTVDISDFIINLTK